MNEIISQLKNVIYKLKQKGKLCYTRKNKIHSCIFFFFLTNPYTNRCIEIALITHWVSNLHHGFVTRVKKWKNYVLIVYFMKNENF